MGTVLILWAVAALSTLFPWLKSALGLHPRDVHHWWGVLTMWLVHGDLHHLIANSSPLFFLFWAVLSVYPRFGLTVSLLSLLLGGLVLWVIGRDSIHIGASVWIYALGSFLFFSGLFRREKRAVGAALLTAFLYGSMVWGLLPLEERISWEGHLSGALAGLFIAFWTRRWDPPFREDDEEPSWAQRHDPPTSLE
jgi:membrane associated rhomboid family serine protease